MSWCARCVLSLAGLAPLFVSSNAHADVSSWMLVAGGAGNVPTVAERRTLGTMQLDTGFGSSPQGNWVVGGLVRSLTFFDAGTDLALLLRTSTGGFSRGQWGLALDVGGYQRWWGKDQTGLQASLSLGGPWGLTLGVGGAFDGQNQSVALTLGIDWARATAHRQSGQSSWTNYVLPLPGHD